MGLRKKSKPYQILKGLLLAGGVIFLTGFAVLGGAPLIVEMMKDYSKNKKSGRAAFGRDLKRLQEREMIDYRELPDGRIRIVLTKTGRQEVLNYNFDELKLNTDKRWDQKWRMVMFDIPNYQKKERDALRRKLRTLGLYPIQESVFITPHECEKEIDFICSIFNIRRHVLIFHINQFEGEEKFRRYFQV